MHSGERIKNTPSVDGIAGNEDLLLEILLHLPPKSLLRFQCVSKHWLSLISDPQFRCRHSRQNPNSVATALFYYKKLPFIEFGFISLNAQENQINTLHLRFLDFIDKFSDVFNAHSCNGLFCVHAKLDGLVSGFICNPTTNQSIELPWLVRAHTSSVVAFNLAFDPSKSPHYRVVCVWLLYTSQMYHFSTYTSETQLWRHSGESLMRGQGMSYTFNKGVYWNSAIHWVFKSQPFLCFDVDNECFKAMPSTPIPDGRSKRKIKYFGESEGHLHLIEIYGPRRTLFDVLEMEGDYSKWFTKYRVDLDVPTSTAFTLMTPKEFSIFSVLLEGKEGKVSLLLSISGKFILYDLSDMTIKELPDIIPANLSHRTPAIRPRTRFRYRFLSGYRWHCVGQHIESLSCV